MYPIINRVLYIPGGAGFLPSTVCSALVVSVEVGEEGWAVGGSKVACGYLHTFFQLFQGPGMGGMIFEIQRRMIWGEIIEVSNYWDRRIRIDTLYHRYHV